MLPYMLVRDADVVWRRVRRTAKWVRRHKLRTVAIVVSVWFLVSLLGGHALIAMAEDGEGIQSLPFLSALNPKDSGGVDLLHYVFLPYDRGHPITSPENYFVSLIVDPIWMANIFGLSWSLWFLTFLISMEWVSWIATPIEEMFKIIADAIGRIGWVSTGLVIAGIIVTIAFFRGQLATGLTKMVISLCAFALAGTLLTNPVGMVTGPGGFLGTAQAWSAAISASIATNDATLLNKPPAADASKQIMTDTLLGQVMDTWVRRPAQEVAFGHILEGQCAEIFNTKMMEVSPLSTGSNTVMDAIKGCDAAAGEYASSPTIANAFSAGIAGFGTQSLNLLGFALGILLLIAVGYSIFKICQWALANLAVVATWGYQAWWGGLLGSIVGAIAVALLVITISAFLSLTTGLMQTISGIPGMSMIAQLFFLDTVIVTMVVVLIWQWVKAKKSGERLAERLARLTGASGGPKAHPVRDRVGRIAEHYVSDMLSRRRGAAPSTPERPPSPIPPRPKPESPVAPAPHALPPGRSMPALEGAPSSPRMDLKTKIANLTATGVQVGAAVASGGTSAAALTLTKEGGKFVLQRGVQHLADNARKGTDATRTESVQRPTFTGFGRRIEVDENGVSRVAPREAPHRGGVYKITNAPTPKAPTSESHMRERLRRVVAEERRS